MVLPGMEEAGNRCTSQMSHNLVGFVLFLSLVCMSISYRVDQLNLTPEIEVFYMLFDRSVSFSSMTSLK